MSIKDKQTKTGFDGIREDDFDPEASFEPSDEDDSENPATDDEVDWRVELDKAWEHFSAAADEGLAGVSALIDALIFFGSDDRAPTSFSVVIPFLRLLRSMLELWRASLPEAEHQAKTFNAAKLEALRAVRSAVALEARRFGDKWPRTEDEENHYEVYRSILSIIDREIEKSYNAGAYGKSKGFKKVDIE